MVSGKLTKLESGFLAGFLLALAVLVMAASTPSGFTPWSAFVGTNRIIIRTNAAGNLVQVDGQAIIDSSNSLASQISAAQVWTNDAVQIYPKSLGQVFLGDLSLLGSPAAGDLEIRGSNDTLFASVFMTRNTSLGYGGTAIITLEGTVPFTSGGGNIVLSAQNEAGGQDVVASIYDGGGAVGMRGASGGNVWGFTNAATGVAGFAGGKEGLLIGLLGTAEPVSNGGTNVGTFSLVLADGHTGNHAAHYAEIRRVSPTYAGSDDPLVPFAVECLDSRDSAAPILICRTNNGTFKAFEVDGTKTTNATPLDVAGPTTLYGGLQVKNSATLDGGVTVGPSTASLFLGTNWQFVSDSLVPNHDLRLFDNWNLTTPLLMGTNGVLTLSNGLSLPTGAGAAKVWTSVDSSGAGSWSNVPASSFTSLLIQTNGVDAGYATNINFPSNATVTISGQTATVGLTASGSGTSLTGTTNWVQLSVQAANRYTTNYPGIDSSWLERELVYYKTNAEGSIASLSGYWNWLVPKDYATNSLNVILLSSLVGTTNGPNTSNSIFRVSVAKSTPGSGVDIHALAFGTAVSGTNTWTASASVTNNQQSLQINLGTASLLKAGDMCVLKVDRDAVNDTFGGATSLDGQVQLEYTRP